MSLAVFFEIRRSIMDENILELRSVTKSYVPGINVIENMNLSIRRGELVTFLGPSGCGKTTTLRMIGGFDLPDSGEILLHGQDIGQLPPNERPINTVFQKYALFPFLNIYDNIAFGLRQKKMDRDLIRQKVRHALTVVDLEGFEKRGINELFIYFDTHGNTAISTPKPTKNRQPIM